MFKYFIKSQWWYRGDKGLSVACLAHALVFLKGMFGVGGGGGVDMQLPFTVTCA